MKFIRDLIILSLLSTAFVLVGVPAKADTYIVKPQDTKSSEFFNFFSSKKPGRSIKHSLSSIDAFSVELDDASLREFSKNVPVSYLEKNEVFHINSIPSQQWGLGPSESNGIDVAKAWEFGLGSKEVIVAVIDTGVEYTHSAIKNNMWVNEDEIAGNGVDDDGNGFVDDIYGYDFANMDSDPMDDHSHGTHCAGVIGANSSSLMGVSPNVKIMALKFLTGSGSGTLEGAIMAIEYAVKNGATILSNSWGGGGYTKSLEDAIKYAQDNGVLFVAAAGNEYNNNDVTPTYPASYKLDNVISVCASNESGKKAYFSNYGKKSVHVCAPGMNIYSAVTGNNYGKMSGTSMACPHVAGLAALVLSHNVGVNYSVIKEKILEGAVAKSGLISVSQKGLINAFNSVK